MNTDLCNYYFFFFESMGCTHWRCWSPVPEGVLTCDWCQSQSSGMLCKCFTAANLPDILVLSAFKHLHTQACVSARNAHRGLHPTRPILIRDVRMETTHENALLPWWPARIERCSEGNFQRACVCGTNAHIQTYTFSKPLFQPDLVTGISITCLMAYRKKSLCGFLSPCRITQNTLLRC